QVVERARAHLERHTSLRLGRRADAEPLKEGEMNKWIQARAAQYAAEGMTQADAEAQAKADYQALAPEVRAKIEGVPAEGDEQETKGLLARLFGGRGAGGDVHVHLGGQPAAQQPVQARAEPEAKAKGEEPKAKADAKPADKPQQRSARDEWLQARAALLQVEEGLSEADARAAAQEQLDADYGLQARLAAAPQPEPADRQDLPQEIRALLRRPEDPMAAIASGLRVRSPRLEGDQLLAEVLMRTVVPQVGRQRPSTRQLTEAYNMLAEAGIHSRALSIETDGTVIREELARQFVVKPEPD